MKPIPKLTDADAQRIAQLEAEGLTYSDATAVICAEKITQRGRK
jgi:hypothetical protein